MEIIVNTSPSCQSCRITKRELDSAGVEYTTRDLSDPANAGHLDRLKAHFARPILDMPVIEVDGKPVMSGLIPSTLGEVIANAKAANE